MTTTVEDIERQVTMETSRITDFQDFLNRIDTSIAARAAAASEMRNNGATSSEGAVVPVVVVAHMGHGDHRIIVDDLYNPMLMDGGEIPAAERIEDNVKNQIQALITNISGRLPSKHREQFSDNEDNQEQEDDQEEEEEDDSLSDDDGCERRFLTKGEEDEEDEFRRPVYESRSKPRRRPRHRTKPAFNSRNYPIQYMRETAKYQKKKTVTAGSLQIADPTHLIEMKSIKSKSRARRIVQIGKLSHIKPDPGAGPESRRREKPFKCSLCFKTFNTSSNLRLHERTHTGHRPYKCLVCDKSFGHKSNLNRHERVHTGYMPYVCGYCGKGFAQSTGCNEHVKLHLINADRLPFPCNRCTKRFSSQLHLDDHLSLHDFQSKVHDCAICGDKFSPISALHHHMKTHTGSDSFICQVCGASFNQSHNLTIHMRRHDNFKPFQCSWCQMRFCRSSDLGKHEELHRREDQGGKPIQSRSRSVTRLANSVEERHRRTRKVEQLTCPICEKVFSSKRSLNSHQKQHKTLAVGRGQRSPTSHRGRSYQCEYCTDTFSNKSDLKYHVNKHKTETCVDDSDVDEDEDEEDEEDEDIIVSPTRTTKRAAAMVAARNKKRLDAKTKRRLRKKSAVKCDKLTNTASSSRTNGRIITESRPSETSSNYYLKQQRDSRRRLVVKLTKRQQRETNEERRESRIGRGHSRVIKLEEHEEGEGEEGKDEELLNDSIGSSLDESREHDYYASNVVIDDIDDEDEDEEVIDTSSNIVTRDPNETGMLDESQQSSNQSEVLEIEIVPLEGDGIVLDETCLQVYDVPSTS